MAYALSGYLAQSNMAMAKTKCQFRPVTALNWLKVAGWFGSGAWFRPSLDAVSVSAGMPYCFIVSAALDPAAAYCG